MTHGDWLGVWDEGAEGVKMNEIMIPFDPNHLHSGDFVEVLNICGLYIFICMIEIFAHRIFFHTFFSFILIRWRLITLQYCWLLSKNVWLTEFLKA